MDIRYIAQARIPTEKAHGIQITHTCAALARTGARVELVVPRRESGIALDLFDFYGLERNFSVRRLRSIDLFRNPVFKSVAFAIETIVFGISLWVYLRSVPKNVVIYGRDEAMLSLATFFSKNVFWETHTGNTNVFARFLMRRAKGIVCITKGLADLYVRNGVPVERLVVAADAVDLERFAKIQETKEDLRSLLGLPQKAKLVLYSGSVGLYSWKGVDVFLDSSNFISDPAVRWVVVGGTQADIERLSVQYKDSRIIYVNKVPPLKVPLYLKAADILVLPNKAGNQISEMYTSPMKLYEYMASGRPIVASDLLSIREALNNENALLVPSNNPQALATAIEKIISDRPLGERLAAKAVSDAQKYTWDARARKLADFIEKK